jgi:hypothetical protein
MKIFVGTSFVFLALLAVSCGYRLVDPTPGDGYALIQVRNVTPEPGLDRTLTRELDDLGSFDPKARNRLSVVITRFEEAVGSVSAGGVTVRERLKLEVEWKVQGSDNSSSASGKETVTGTYPYSDDPVALDWNRSAAIRLLSNDAAQRILDQLERLP